jgi:hypothetical protein
MIIAGKRRVSAPVAALLAGGLLGGLAMVSTAAASPAAASTATNCTITATSTSSTTSPLYGVNYSYSGAADFKDANVDPLISELDPGALRYPGGTPADYFNWSTGKPTDGKYTYAFTLAKLERAYQATGAAPIFDLNVLASANRLNTTEMVNALKAAQADGLPVKYVELGNELYGGGTFPKAFHSGAVYGRTVEAYVPVLHCDFPGVQVAADAVLNPSSTRQKRWNRQLLATATGADAPDALILHDYPGLIYDPFTQADVPPLFANAYTAIKELTAKVASLHGKPVWLTEYNFRGPNQKNKPNQARTSYARELYLAAFALMLPRIPHLSLADYFSALGTPDYGAWINPAQPTLTPSGQAAAMIDAAARGASSSTPITVPGAPTLPGGGAAVTGQAFAASGRATTALLVNLTSSAQDVPTGADVPDGAGYQQSVGTPTAQLSAAAPLTSGTVSGKDLKLPAYSITLVNTTISA